MLKRFGRYALVLVAAIAFTSGNKAKAGPPYVSYYDVRYACQIGPEFYGQPVGYWTLDCDGNMTGWGWEPYYNCTYTVESQGDFCNMQP